MAPALNAYSDRIGYTGPVAPTLDVLRAIHRAHLLNVTYENLDIHLGWPLTLDLPAIFDKIVNRKRGGWCYEMNGLLAWALREIGFDVRLLGGSVNRARLGDAAEGNHLVLLVQLDRPWLADAGFGNSILEPLPLVEGEHAQNGFVFRLQRTPPPTPPLWGGEKRSERWFFQNQPRGGAGFDFTLEPRELGDFTERCAWLQTSPESGFVRVAVCHRMRQDGIVSLRGAVLQHVTPDGVAERVIEAEDDYRRVLEDEFDLDLGDDVHRLWPKVWASHLVWMAEQRLTETTDAKGV
jgi:N-hydroxyarylamine O-acetyltransferase